LSGVVGPVAAGPLIGGGHDAAWLILVIAGCLVAAVMALRLHHRLTPAQDGRGLAGTTLATSATGAPDAEATLASDSVQPDAARR
jgi:hypothetical protein